MSTADLASISVEAAPRYERMPNRKRFQAFSDLHVLLLTLDAEGSIQHITPALRSALEYGPEEAIQPCFFSHVHPKNLYRVMRDTAEMVACGKPMASWLLRLRTGRNRWRWFNATVRNELYGVASPSIVVVLRDVCG